MKIRIYREEEDHGLFYFSIDKNNKPLLRSYGYSQKVGAKVGINSVINGDAERFKIKKNKRRYVFSFVSKNHITVAESVLSYRSEKEAQAIIDQLAKVDDDTEVVDITKRKKEENDE